MQIYVTKVMLSTVIIMFYHPQGTSVVYSFRPGKMPWAGRVTTGACCCILFLSFLAIFELNVVSLSANAQEVKPDEDSKALLAMVRKEYEAKHYEKALSLLLKQLQEHPDDPTSRYYAGLVRKKLGFDMQALEDLDLATRMASPELIEMLTQETLKTSDEHLPELKEVLVKPRPPKDWGAAFGSAFNNLWQQTFNGKKSGGGQTQSSAQEANNTEDFGALFRELKEEGKKIFQGDKPKEKKVNTRVAAQVSASADIMPMAEMMKLVDTAGSINSGAWSSHPQGLTKFHQAPENTAQWDYWILRFRKAFQYRLLQYLYAEEKGQVRGAAVGIFSIDNKGNLRGSVYASTADGVLNKCLVKTIRDLDHSRILAFPSNSRITGYNFRMVWDFGKLLKYVHARKVYAVLVKIKEEEALRLEAQRLEQEKVKAQLKARQEARAKLLKQKAQKLKEELARQRIQVKADVAGRVLSEAKAEGLQAVALPLLDLTPVPETDNAAKKDVFEGIGDKQLLEWPELGQ